MPIELWAWWLIDPKSWVLTISELTCVLDGLEDKIYCEYLVWGERSTSSDTVPVRALPYIRIGIQMLISLSLLRNLSPKNSLSMCNTPEDFGQGAVEGFQPFSISWWVFPLFRFRFCLYGLFCLWWFCSGLALNACFSIAGRL